MTSKGQHDHNKSKVIVVKIKKKKGREKEWGNSQLIVRLALKLCVKDERGTFPNYVFPFESVY